MVLALIAPEVITGIAVKERLAAKDYMEYWNANFMPLCKLIHPSYRPQNVLYLHLRFS